MFRLNSNCKLCDATLHTFSTSCICGAHICSASKCDEWTKNRYCDKNHDNKCHTKDCKNPVSYEKIIVGKNYCVECHDRTRCSFRECLHDADFDANYCSKHLNEGNGVCLECQNTNNNFKSNICLRCIRKKYVVATESYKKENEFHMKYDSNALSKLPTLLDLCEKIFSERDQDFALKVMQCLLQNQCVLMCNPFIGMKYDNQENRLYIDCKNMETLVKQLRDHFYVDVENDHIITITNDNSHNIFRVNCFAKIKNNITKETVDGFGIFYKYVIKKSMGDNIFFETTRYYLREHLISIKF